MRRDRTGERILGMARRPPGCHLGEMAPAELLDDAIERTVLVEHVGKSGAALERVTSRDGRSVVVKRITPETDLTLAIFHQPFAHEFLLWRSGGLDRLPDGVGHVVIDGWTEGEDTTVIVMRDLGDAVLTLGRPSRRARVPLDAGAGRGPAPRLPRRSAGGGGAADTVARAVRTPTHRRAGPPGGRAAGGRAPRLGVLRRSRPGAVRRVGGGLRPAPGCDDHWPAP